MQGPLVCFYLANISFYSGIHSLLLFHFLLWREGLFGFFGGVVVYNGGLFLLRSSNLLQVGASKLPTLLMSSVKSCLNIYILRHCVLL